jgi:hypothetical protein
MYFYLPYAIIIVLALIALTRGESLNNKNFLCQLGAGLALMLLMRDILSLSGFI